MCFCIDNWQATEYGHLPIPPMPRKSTQHVLHVQSSRQFLNDLCICGLDQSNNIGPRRLNHTCQWINAACSTHQDIIREYTGQTPHSFQKSFSTKITPKTLCLQ